MIQSVDRALTILSLFIGHKKELGITEISQELNLPKSTVHGLVKTLEKNLFLQLTQSGKYRVGIKAYELGMTYSANIELNTAAEPMVIHLAKKYKQTVHIAIYAGKMAVFVASNKAGSPHVIFPRIGGGVPAYCTAVGKVLLAWQPPDYIERYLTEEQLLPITPNTISDKEVLQKELRQIKQQGYAIDREEILVNLACVAAPIFEQSGQVIAAISVSGTAQYIYEEINKDCIKDVMDAANMISTIMGYKH